MAGRLRLLPALALAILLGFAGYMSFWGEDPRAPYSPKLRGLDLVSFWAPGTVLDAGEPEKLYTRARLRREFRKLHPEKPPGYPVGYPPPIYQLAALPQPTFSYLASVKVAAFVVALLHAVAAVLTIKAVRMPADHPRREAWWWWSLGLGIALPGAISTLLSGQLGGLWTLPIGAAWLLRRQRQRAWAGVALAVLWMKPTLALPVALALALLGQGAMLAGMVAGGAGILALSLAADGLAPWQAYLARLQDADRLLDDFWIYRHRQVTARSLVGSWAWDDAWREAAGWVAAAAAALVAVGVAWRGREAAADPLARDLYMGMVLAWALFAGPHMFEYDLGLNTFALAAGFAWLLTGRARHPRWGRVAVAAAWAAPVLTLPPVVSTWALAPASTAFWVIWGAAELLGRGPRAAAGDPAGEGPR